MNRIRETRKALGLTLKDLGSYVGCTESAMSHYEKGIREPDNATLVLIASKLNVSVDYLLGISDIPDPVKDDPVPLTDEVRILAEGIDKLPQSQKDMVMNIVKTILSQYPDHFEKGTKEE